MPLLIRPSWALLFLCFLFFKSHQGVFSAGYDSCADNSTHTDDVGAWSWDRILKDRQTIVANGNVWPAREDESPQDCLILVTHNQIMWHCPSGEHVAGSSSGENHHSHRNTVIFRTSHGRLRGAFSAPGTDRRRLWLLESRDRDILMELDTVSGEIVQVLEVEGTRDGHDAVRVDDRVFVVDTRNGHVVEIELPASAPPYKETSVVAGAKIVRVPGFVNIVKRHTGFTKTDHINNVAIHPQLLISNLHGGSHPNRIIPDTRLTALSRTMSEADGRELNQDQDGFKAISNVGTWCHNIAFWEDQTTSDIKLISLDSMAGTLVSVSASGPGQGQREVLWSPDPSHAVLVPPEGVAKAYDNGARVFTKGLAVQGGVAYFAASYARAPPLRKNVPETLLVAVDLATRRELWTRTIRSNGLLNQILTESYLGWQVQLPTEISSTELTYHGGGGSLVDHCQDIVPKRSRFCKPFEKDYELCDQDSDAAWEALEVCCACDGGNQYLLPLLAGKLDEEIMKLDEEVTATATFVHTNQCSDNTNGMKHIPLSMKSIDKIHTIANLDRNIDYIVKHICNLNISRVQEHLNKEEFKNADLYDKQEMNDMVQLVDSSTNGNNTNIFHLPRLEGWLPTIDEVILQPLGLSLNHIIRMMFSATPNNSVHHTNSENFWARKSHRVHVPLFTHPHAFFLTEIENEMDEREVLRIRSNPGEVYEFNNALPYTVYNHGVGRYIYLVLDWIEEEISETENMDLIKLSMEDQCNRQLQTCNLPYDTSLVSGL